MGLFNFWKKKKKAPPVRLSTHEKYPEILQWIIGDKIECSTDGVYYEHVLRAINEDCTIVVSFIDELYVIPLKDVDYNISLKNRKIRAMMDENTYNQFLIEVQKQYQALLQGDSPTK